MPANFLPNFVPPENSLFLKEKGATVNQYKNVVVDNNKDAKKFLKQQRARLENLSRGNITADKKTDSPYYQIMTRSLAILNTAFTGANIYMPLQRLNIELNKSINSAKNVNIMEKKLDWEKQDFRDAAAFATKLQPKIETLINLVKGEEDESSLIVDIEGNPINQKKPLSILFADDLSKISEASETKILENFDKLVQKLEISQAKDINQDFEEQKIVNAGGDEESVVNRYLADRITHPKTLSLSHMTPDSAAEFAKYQSQLKESAEMFEELGALDPNSLSAELAKKSKVSVMGLKSDDIDSLNNKFENLSFGVNPEDDYYCFRCQADEVPAQLLESDEGQG